MGTVSKTGTLEINPSGYNSSHSSYSTVSSSYPISNGYTGSGSTTYARITCSSGTTSYISYTFDVSDIPSDATIDSITCVAKARVSSTSRFSSAYLQLYCDSTAKGSTTSFLSTSTSTTYTLTPGTWTRAELDDIELRATGTTSSGGGGGGSRYIYFYGATLTIEYTYDETTYTVSVTNNSSATVSPTGSQSVTSGDSVNVSVDTLSGITVTDNGTDVTSQFTQQTGGTAVSYPTSYSTSGSISGTKYTGAIGNGSDASASSGSDYCSSSGSTAYIDYAFDFSSIPESATIDSVTVTVKGHCEDSSKSTEVATLQLYSGSTAKGDESEFTSSSDEVVTMTPGTWTRSELQSAVLRFTIGYYGGQVTGATFTVVYSVSGDYTYTISNITADHTIIVSNQTALYLKSNGSWVEVTAAYRKVSGAWTQISVDSAFSSGTNYVSG